MKKLKNISVLATINQYFLINAANAIPTGARIKVTKNKGLATRKTILGIQTRIQINKQDKDIILNFLLFIPRPPLLLNTIMHLLQLCKMTQLMYIHCSAIELNNLKGYLKTC